MWQTTLLIAATLIHTTRSERRFIIDDDNDLNKYFAFPIDVCFQSRTYTNTQFVKYTCSENGDSVTKRIYPNASCDDQSVTNIKIYTSDDKSPCNGSKFSCVGEDQYQMISYFYQYSCSSNALIEVPIVLGCYCDTNTTSYYTDCINEPMAGSISFFDDTSCSSSLTTTQYDLTECNIHDIQQSIPIYVKQTGCILSPPTSSPTISPTLSHALTQDMSALNNLAIYYQYTAGGFVFIFSMIVVLSFIDAKICRTNDYYKISAIISMILQTVDLLSDCFFAAEIGLRYKMEPSFVYMIMFYACMTFIILPSLTALFQLYFYAKKHWLDSDYVRSWLSKYSTFLLFVSLITGSSFAAVSLLNSYIFQIELFDMGLTYKQLKRFHTRRIWSVVVLENMPQLLLQSYYFWTQLQVQDRSINFVDNAITLSSMSFSIISIIISLLSLTMQKAINNTQQKVIISMDITGDSMEQRSSKCRTMSTKLKRYMARIIGVNVNMIEVVKPMYITKGLRVDIIIYVNDNRYGNISDYDKRLKQANEKGKLATLLQKAWKLKRGVPMVSNIRQQTVQSKQTRNSIRLSLSPANSTYSIREQQLKIATKYAMGNEGNEGKLGNEGNEGNEGNNEFGKDNELIKYIEQQHNEMMVYQGHKQSGIPVTLHVTPGGYASTPVGNSRTQSDIPPPPPPPPVYNPNARAAYPKRNTSSMVNTVKLPSIEHIL